jgi:hypothetical protein
MTPEQITALNDLRAAPYWKVVTLTHALHGGVLVVVRQDRHRAVARITNLNIHPDGRVQITAGPIPTTRRKRFGVTS